MGLRVPFALVAVWYVLFYCPIKFTINIIYVRNKKTKKNQAKQIIVSFSAACQLEQEVNTANSAFM
jgi:MFS-type transporter involved in bile tolerance (Atg22 family)